MKRLFAPFVLSLLCILNGKLAFAQDYTITTGGSAIVLTDALSGVDIVNVSENGTDIRLDVVGKTYSLNGGGTLSFPIDIALGGVNSITIDAGAGNDSVNIGAFTAALPNLTVIGGGGNDAISFNGNITFATNANLDVNLQDDNGGVPGTDSIKVTAGSLILSGTGAADLRASRNIKFSASTTLRTVNGNLTLEANQQASPTTSANFRGIDAVAANILIESTGTGLVSVKGKGGVDGVTTGSNVYSVGVGIGFPTTGTGSILRGGTTGTLIVEGRGGASVGNQNHGVMVGGTGSFITSIGANVSVTGFGGGASAAQNNNGVRPEGGTISAGGSGTVTVNGTGGAVAANNQFGVLLVSASTITSSGGSVTVIGQGGGISGLAGNSPQGVNVQGGSTITSGGTGTVTVTGTAGNTTGTNAYGLVVSGSGGSSSITSNGGNVIVTGTGSVGTGSTLGAGRECRGVQVQASGANNATISAGGSGTVTVVGNGGGSGTSGGSQFHTGVYITAQGSGITGTAQITSSGGNVSVTGNGGGAGTATQGNAGVNVRANQTSGSSARITAGGTGTVTVIGLGGNSTGTGNTGIGLDGGGTITSSGGNVSVTGTGGGSGASSQNDGISLLYQNQPGPGVIGPGIITAGGSGTVTVVGIAGGGSGGNNKGVSIGSSLASAPSLITSNGGNVSVTGTGGSAGGNSNFGIVIDGSPSGASTITAGTGGNVTVNGSGGNATGNQNYGVFVSGTTSTQITAAGGNVSVTGTGGGSGSAQFGIGVIVSNAAKITATGSGTVTVNGTGANTTGSSNFGVNVTGTSSAITSSGGHVNVTGNGGGSSFSAFSYGVHVQSAGSISSTGSGLLNVTGTGGGGATTDNHGVYVRDASSLITSATGNISITGARGANAPDAADILLDNSGAVTSTGGATITFNGTSTGLWPNNFGTDVTTSAAVTFATNSGLNIDIDGITANQMGNGYQQLNVAGQVNLNNVDLTFTGSSYNPGVGNTFTVVANDGGDAIVGTFNGLLEGDTIKNFLGTSLGAKVTYAGGTGNDVVLTVVVVPIVYIWTGAISTDWFVSGNWNPAVGLPSSGTDVVIPNVSAGSNRYPTIDDTQTAEAEDLTINAGAKITFVTVGGGNMPEFGLYGDFTNNGTAYVGDGQIQFVKPGTQTLNGPLETGGMIMVSQGTHLVTNGYLTLASGGQIIHGENLAAGLGGPYQFGTVSNHPVTVKRTGNPGVQTWNYWGSPVTGASINALGSRPHYYDALSATDPNTTGGLQDGWKTASGVMAPGVGYISQGGRTVAFTGTVDFWNTDPTVNVPVSKGVVPYNMLANPFPSAMDATTFMATNGPSGNGSLTGDIWFWDEDGTGGSGYSKTDFAVWNGTGSAGPNSARVPSGNIATGQGFFVEAVTNGANVQFTNAQRSIFNDQFLKVKPVERLWVNVTNTQGLYNEVLIGFLDVATEGYDMGYDARKMRGNENIALYTKMQSEQYMIQALPLLTGNRVVELGLDAGLTGTHTLALKQIENMDETVMVLLEDRLTGTLQNLRVNPNYEFTVDAAGTIAGRFFLHFNAPLEIAAAEESCDGKDGAITLNQSGTQIWNYTLTDASGKLVDLQPAFNGSLSLNGLEQGDYTLALSDNYGYQLTKTITVDGKQKVTAAFAASADEVTTDDAVAFTNNSAGATSYEWNFGDGSVSTSANPEHQYADAGIYTVTLHSSNDDCVQSTSQNISVTKLTTGINSIAENNVNIFAFGNTLYVKFDFEKEEKAELTVYDVLGQKVLDRQITTSGNHTIQLQHAAVSNYFVQVQTKDKVFTTKVLVRR